MTIRSVYLGNARSHKRTKLTLHRGLNVIVGASDSGKSNIVRALRAVVFNESYDRLVRTGGGEARVTVRTSKGVVRLVKGKSRNDYSVNGESFTRVGRGVPDGVDDVLGLSPVTLGGEVVDIHFAGQRDEAFGVDTKPPVLAKIVGGVCGLSAVLRSVDAAAKKKRESEREVARLEKELADTDKRIAEFRDRVDLDAIERQLAKIERIEKKAEQLEQQATVCDELADRLVRLHREAKAASPSVELLNRVDKLMAAIERSESKQSEIDGLLVRLTTAKEKYDTAKRDVDEWASGRCPTCGQEVEL